MDNTVRSVSVCIKTREKTDIFLKNRTIQHLFGSMEQRINETVKGRDGANGVDNESDKSNE